MKISSFYWLLPLFLVSCDKCDDAGKGDKTASVCYPWEVDSVNTDFAKYVDPMIGTAGHGHTFPGACAPFGMVQLSPDTRTDGSWDGCSGYHYDDSVIYGFSHTHLSGTGCSDYGDILFMPETDHLVFENGSDGKEGYRSAFSHDREHATAGYYDVYLNKPQVEAEMTASPRVGVHRYTFPKGKEAWMLVDLTHRDETLDAEIVVGENSISGYRTSRAWASDQRVYFYAEFSRPFDEHTFAQAWHTDTVVAPDPNRMKSKKAAVALSFKNASAAPIIVKVALSPVSVENAKLNMQTEVPDFDFDAVKKKVQQQWNSELGKIEVKELDVHKLRTFYTALYHCFVSPNLYCDVNGDYRGMDNQIHRDTIHPQYSVFSLWDTYRALHPLFTIIQPKRDQDFINTFLKQYKEGGTLPVWELSANETNCMIGYHSVPVIVDAWMKGLTDFDTALAYEAMKHSAMSDDRGLKQYKKFGFIPAEGESESVSKTLEYAYDDWCISLAAGRMHKTEDEAYFRHRSESWRNLYDPETGFMRARLNNAFVAPFDPNEVNFHYTEANAWQYSLAVQQDIPGLIEAHGGDKKFIAFLDKLFSTSSQTSGRDQADISGLIGQYAQGNEPSHHMAYLYDYTSQPWKTQELVSRICREQYSDKPDGLCGNEDCGQMSAWYVMSMMGIYQTTPGLSAFVLSEPQFDSISVHLSNKMNFGISRIQYDSNVTRISCFPQGVMEIYINEAPTLIPTITIQEIVKGANYKFREGHPGPLRHRIVDMNGVSIREVVDWEIRSFNNVCDFFKGTRLVPESGNVCSDKAALPLPPVVHYAVTSGSDGNIPIRTFTEGMDVIFYQDPGLRYFISRNGGSFKEETVQFRILETTSIRAFTQNEFGIRSDTVEFKYNKIPAGRSIKLNSKYQNQYAAGGDNALIDGIKGSDNFRTGEWQGYEGNDLEAVVDLGSTKDVSKISINFLQDQGAWIFMPSDVIFYGSIDGKIFTQIDDALNGVDPKHDGPILYAFSTQVNSKYRYIKVVAKNIGTCPQWHPGKGNPSWIFADEMEIETK